jgi:hypothetical protein
MNSKLLKGLLLTIIGTFIALYNEPNFMWSVCAITLLGSALVYIGKNAIPALQSNAPQGTWVWQNTVSAILIAIGSGITEAVATIAGTGVIIWPLLFKVVGSIVMTYITATLFEGTKVVQPIAPPSPKS